MTGQFEVAGAVDNWEPACKTFAFNHPETDSDLVQCYDLSKIVRARKATRQKWIEPFGKIDVIVGGPPCQGLSLAGKRLDEDPRNNLFNSFVECVRLLQPKAFVMENVPGLLSMREGALNQAILSAFRRIGYNHFEHHMPAILKSEEYGVPQIRRRLFYIGFRDDIDDRNFIWPPRPIRQEYTRKTKPDTQQQGLWDTASDATLPPPVTVREAISDLPLLKVGEGSDEIEYADKAGNLTDYQTLMRDWSLAPDDNRPKRLYNHEAPRNTDKLITLIKKASPGDSVDPKYSDSKKWHPDLPSFTIKALGAGGGSTNRRPFHYDTDQPRGSTVRENARIQSFPDWYRFLGPKTHQMTQVGNAVPPLMAKAIAATLANLLDQQ